MLSPHALRHRRALAGAAVAAAAALLAAAPAAEAGFSTWTPLSGLDAASGASWVREYEFAPPTTVYAGTEGNGVYRSDTAGLSWRPFNDGLLEIPGARDIRDVYADGPRVYAGTGAGLFVSTGGAFTPLAQQPEPDPRHPIRLHRAVQRLFRVGGTLLAGTMSGGVYRSGDDGATWVRPAPGNGMPTSTTVWDLDSLIPGVVFAATSDGVFRSTDGGASWTPSSDGIGGVTLRVFKDPGNPNIFYAGTTSGVYRSMDLGFTWTQVNGSGDDALGPGAVRGLVPFRYLDVTRLYAATGDGLWVGTTGNGPLPGPVRWRKVTEQGLAVGREPNDILWTVSPHLLPSGTIFAGTQSNGGYALTFEPPQSVTAPSLSTTEPRVGVAVSTDGGTWRGTPTIELSYQWQRCSSDQASSCADITGATDPEYVPKAVDQAPPAKRLRVVVTAENDFPSLGLIQRPSAITSTVAVNPNPTRVPGYDQMSAPSISADAPADVTLPQVGDTLRAGPGLFNPAAATRRWTWYRCNETGGSCARIDGVTGQTFTLGEEDLSSRLKVSVTGTNADGSATTPLSGETNVVFPADPVVIDPPAVLGTPWVGESLVGSTGLWRSGGNYRRRWLRCEADGSDCVTIDGATGPAFAPTANELGKTIRVEVTADPNAGGVFPGPASALSAPSAVVTVAPPVGGDGGGAGGGGGGGAGGGGGGTPGSRDTVKPVLRGVALAAARVRRGGAIVVRFRASEPGRLTVTLDRLVPGRKAAKRGAPCRPGAKRGRRCTATVRVRTLRPSVRAGAGTLRIAVPRRGKSTLPLGRYRLTLTPVDAAGNRGKARVVGVTVAAAKAKARARR